IAAILVVAVLVVVVAAIEVAAIEVVGPAVIATEILLAIAATEGVAVVVAAAIEIALALLGETAGAAIEGGLGSRSGVVALAEAPRTIAAAETAAIAAVILRLRGRRFGSTAAIAHRADAV